MNLFKIIVSNPSRLFPSSFLKTFQNLINFLLSLKTFLILLNKLSRKKKSFIPPTQWNKFCEREAPFKKFSVCSLSFSFTEKELRELFLFRICLKFLRLFFPVNGTKSSHCRGTVLLHSHSFDRLHGVLAVEGKLNNLLMPNTYFFSEPYVHLWHFVANFSIFIFHTMEHQVERADGR